ncbi:MAG: hypothetical protein KGM49_05450 [Sphingomonadales bacterium]|nr:hypothetical protein [Sphingomonadales bacterium]
MTEQILGELIDYRSGDQLGERVLDLRCEINNAMCDLYRFVEIHGSTFESERCKARFCKSLDTIRDLFVSAIARWIEKVRLADKDHRTAWARSIDRILNEQTHELRCQLSTEQVALTRRGAPAQSSVRRSVC